MPECPNAWLSYLVLSALIDKKPRDEAGLDKFTT